MTKTGQKEIYIMIIVLRYWFDGTSKFFIIQHTKSVLTQNDINKDTATKKRYSN